MFQSDIAHRRPVAVLCNPMIRSTEIRCNPMHPHYGALPGPHVPERVTRGALVAHRYTYSFLAAEARSTALPLFFFRCQCLTILLTPYWMVRNWRVSRAGPVLFYWPKLLYPFWSSTTFPFSSSSRSSCSCTTDRWVHFQQNAGHDCLCTLELCIASMTASS